jgi:hypothetical protein
VVIAKKTGRATEPSEHGDKEKCLPFQVIKDKFSKEENNRTSVCYELLLLYENNNERA